LEIQVCKAVEEDKTPLRRMMELYLYDFSEYTGSDLDKHGVYGYERLDYYWIESNRFPFLVRVDGRLAGFVLVRDQVFENGESIHYMAEFFVVRKYRRQGVGREAALQVFRQFPGLWRVPEIDENLPAQAFWRKIIGDFTGGRFREVRLQDWEGPVQEFWSLEAISADLEAAS
jgi:predicted acetyltransferase